jgi:hypothetical protein
MLRVVTYRAAAEQGPHGAACITRGTLAHAPWHAVTPAGGCSDECAPLPVLTPGDVCG